MFYGDRRATVKDPFGNIWQIATHQGRFVARRNSQTRRGRIRAAKSSARRKSCQRKSNPFPTGRAAMTPYLIVSNAAEMIDFYKNVFGATETMRFKQPGRPHRPRGTENQRRQLSCWPTNFPKWVSCRPRSLGGKRSPVSIHLYVENVDEVYKRALAAGATSLREPEDQFYGDRNAQVRDPSGHCWDLSMRIEEVSPEEMQKRFKAMVNPS